MPSIGDSMIIIVAAMPTGCRAAGEPAKDWCAELAPNQGGVRASGRFSAAYDGLAGTSPGQIEPLVRDPKQTGITVQGCARPANGDLWRLVTVWDNLPPPIAYRSLFGLIRRRNRFSGASLPFAMAVIVGHDFKVPFACSSWAVPARVREVSVCLILPAATLWQR